MIIIYISNIKMYPALDIVTDLISIIKDTTASDHLKISMANILNDILNKHYYNICRESELKKYINTLNKDIEELESYSTVTSEDSEKLINMKNHLYSITYPLTLQENQALNEDNSKNIVVILDKINKLNEDMNFTINKMYEIRDVLSDNTDSNKVDIKLINERISNCSINNYKL